MSEELVVKKYEANGNTVEAVQISSATLAALRDSEWADNQVRLLSYPTAPARAYLGDEPPLAYNGRVLAEGNYLLKGPAGDFEIVPAALFEEGYAEVAA